MNNYRRLLVFTALCIVGNVRIFVPSCLCGQTFCSYYAKNICNSQQKVINYQKIYKNPFTYLLLLALSVAALSYFDSYGGITMDAPWYLRLAQSIKEGNGFAVMSPDYVYYNEAQNFLFGRLCILCSQGILLL